MRTKDAPLLLHAFSTFAMGGPQRRFLQIANAFGPRYRHALVAMDGNTEAAAGLNADVDFQVVPAPTQKSGGLSPGNLWRIAGVVRRLKPDLLLSYNWGAIEWALTNRLFRLAPQVHSEDGFGPEEANGQQISRRVWTRRLALAGRCELLVPSRTLETIARDIWGIPESRRHLVPNGIELEKFAHAEPLPMPFGDGHTVIGTIGMLRAEKNISRLLRAFAAVQDPAARLLIVGDGPARAELEAEAGRLGLGDRVAFLGHTDAPDRAQACFDIFALSSDTEQMPYSVIEAMAAGLPVVATDVGDVGMMLAQSVAEACTVAKEDEAGLTAKLEWLAADPDVCAQIGDANRHHVQANYSIETMLDAYDRLFQARIRR